MEVLSVESGHEVVQSNVPKTLRGQILHLNVGQKMDRAEDTKAEELHLVKLVKQLVKQLVKPAMNESFKHSRKL